MWSFALSRVGRVEVRVLRGVERRGDSAVVRSSIVVSRSSVRSGRLVSGSMVGICGLRVVILFLGWRGSRCVWVARNVSRVVAGGSGAGKGNGGLEGLLSHARESSAVNFL